MSEIQVNKLSPQSGTTVTLGDSGDTFTIPSGATITNSGTATGFGEANTPSFYSYGSSTQVINSASYTLAACNTELWDTDSAYDTSSYTFTVPSGKGGKYHFYFGGELEALANSSKYYRALLYKNGSAMTSPDIANVINFGGSSGDVDAQNASIPLLLSASDTVQFRVYQNSGSNKNLYAGFFFAGFRISS
jgi:hypothetical protein